MAARSAATASHNYREYAAVTCHVSRRFAPEKQNVFCCAILRRPSYGLSRVTCHTVLQLKNKSFLRCPSYGLLAASGLAIGKTSFCRVKKELTGRTDLYMLIFAARGERKSSVESIIRAPFSAWIISKSYRKEIYVSYINVITQHTPYSPSQVFYRKWQSVRHCTSSAKKNNSSGIFAVIVRSGCR